VNIPGEKTLYCLEECRGEQRISPPGDNFTPRGQNSPLGDNFDPGWGSSSPLGAISADEDDTAKANKVSERNDEITSPASFYLMRKLCA
jgi:hypothetical protein